MAWSFVLDHGGDISALVDVRSISKVTRLHTEMRPNSNKLQFSVRYDATLFANLLSYDTIQLTVMDGAAPYFYGYLSPNYKATIRDGQKFIEIIAEDPTLQLLGVQITSTFVAAGYAVCTPAATATSLVHAIATAAGVTLAAGAPTISTVIPYLVVLNDDKMTYAKLLEQILFEYNHVYYFNESGALVLSPTINTSTVAATGTLTTAAGSANIRGEIEIQKTAQKYDDVRVSYNLVQLKNAVTVFKDSDSITLEAAGNAEKKDYWPLTNDVAEVFSNWKSPEGYKIWVVTSPSLSATLGSGITLNRALTNYYKKASFGYRNTAGAASDITGLKITGNAYIIASQNVARVSISGSKELNEYDAEYIFDDTSARALASAMAQYYKYSDIKYIVKSKDVFTLGQYVLVVDAIYAGLSTKCRVVGISVLSTTEVITYQLEEVDDFAAVTLVTEGRYTAPDAGSGQIDSMAEQLVVTPQAKPMIQMRWFDINGDGSTTGSYWQARKSAIESGVNPGSLDYGYGIVYDYLFSSPGVLSQSTWYVNVPITSFFYNIFSIYYQGEAQTLATISRWSSLSSIVQYDCGVYDPLVEPDYAPELDGGTYNAYQGMEGDEFMYDYGVYDSAFSPEATIDCGDFDSSLPADEYIDFGEFGNDTASLYNPPEVILDFGDFEEL
jgi:hypothetical protein